MADNMFNPINSFNLDPSLTPLTGSIEIGYSIIGTVIDSTNNSFLTGVKIKTSLVNSTKTDNQGNFTIVGKTTTDKPITINVSLKGYNALDINPYTGNNEIKSNLGVIQLTPIQKNLDQDIINSSLLTEDEIKSLTLGSKIPSSFIQKRLTEAIVNVKSRLIPVILTLIAGFGVTQTDKLVKKGKDKIDDVIDQTSCPTPDELARIISRKNKLVKQLNNLLKLINSSEKTLEGFLTVIDILTKTLQAVDLATLALPSSVPPGVGIPVGAINKFENLKQATQNNLKAEVSKVGNLNSPLNLLKSSINTALQYLNLLDSLVQYCAPNSSQEQVSKELIALTQQQSNQLSPVVTNVNGFEMGVETEATTNSLKRRRAIARNKGGVVMLQGEWSYSSIDQILIDELVFYIQTNDLKAE
jgi:hypothetical protein